MSVPIESAKCVVYINHMDPNPTRIDFKHDYSIEHDQTRIEVTANQEGFDLLKVIVESLSFYFGEKDGRPM